MTSITASPSATASAPPGQKSFCTSMIRSTSWELISISSPLLLSQLYPTMAFPGSLCGRLKRSLFDAVHMGKARDGALFKGAFSAQNDQKGRIFAQKTGDFRGFCLLKSPGV